MVMEKKSVRKDDVNYREWDKELALLILEKGADWWYAWGFDICCLIAAMHAVLKYLSAVNLWMRIGLYGHSRYSALELWITRLWLRLWHIMPRSWYQSEISQASPFFRWLGLRRKPLGQTVEQVAWAYLGWGSGMGSLTDKFPVWIVVSVSE
jgi:hypothetical protein